VRVGVGTVRWPTGTIDLGAISASGASSYFLGLAGRVDGRLGREALTAAVLADSADTWRGLLAVAANRNGSRGLRESAASWLGREAATLDPPALASLTRELITLAQDADAPSSVRGRAVSALGRTDAAAVGPLVGLARADDPAVAKPAITALGRIADSRAREAIRRAARDSGLALPVRIEAIRALGNRDASPADVAALRSLWPTLGGGDLRQTVLQLVGETGGAENARWLLAVARDQTEPPTVRSHAVRAAERAGAGSAQLVRLFDEAGDRRVKESILDALVRIGDRAAREKVGAVAQSDTDPQLRRAAVARLAKTGDRQALDVLEGMVEKPRP
jgi:HEAT repeat protein